MAEPTREQVQHMRTSFDTFIHNASLATLIIAPTIILLPPRKLDFYTFSLSGAFCIAGTQLYSERRARLGRERRGDWSLPAKAQQIQTQLQQEKQRRLAQGEGKKSGSVLEEKAKEIWMGGETEGWKERRLAEERRKLAEGEGYGSMIMDQIWEVWNWGEKKKAEIVKEKDEAVLKEQRRQAEFPKIGKD